MVNLYNVALKENQKTGKALLYSPPRDKQNDAASRKNIDYWHVYAALREIEPLKPVVMTTHLARCTNETEKRSVLMGTIADGCRASLSALYRNRLAELSADSGILAELKLAEFETEHKTEPRTPITPPCRKLQNELGNKFGVKGLPGILEDKSPPGVVEICEECRFYKDAKSSWEEIAAAKAKADQAPIRPMPDWGRVTEAPPERIDIKNILPRIEQTKEWPLPRDPRNGLPTQNGKERPTVSLIFSGGVFRGVFQVGVLNAFNMAEIKPDLVAGASVGTIMAALSARVFSEKNPQERHRRIASVAATFLSIDRLVLTDRFADFIRRFTLRAGAADFSLRDADHLFRRFDRRDWELLARRSRRVLAGLHRLVYVNPLELLDICSFVSPRKRGQLLDTLLLYAQESLDRAGIGSELLGAEPLEQLIRAHVKGDSDEGAEFDEFLGSDAVGIHFMATATNLTTGELDVLGSFGNEERRPALVPGLLASSAFPAVFRPRMNWELRAGSPGLPEELVDGGIADNLPLVPVYRFLFYAGLAGWLALRPKAGQEARPHLLLTASLEPKRRNLFGEDLKRTTECWTNLMGRVGRLRYNVKVDSHQQTQADLRNILEVLAKPNEQPEIDLLDLHVSCVKPEWLCGTFAFHPMLGFKRDRQAQSIAHGCACTLVHLCREQVDHKDWTPHWWSHLEPRNTNNVQDRESDIKPHPVNSCGDCWFVQGHKCPFSESELLKVQPELGKETQAALAEIYHHCGQAKTHRRPKE